MKYWQAKKIPSREFKRMTGVKKNLWRDGSHSEIEGKKKKKPGRPSKLRIEDQILVTLQYLREYRSYYHIGKTWKISESNVF